jgi:hypothetical protein
MPRFLIEDVTISDAGESAVLPPGSAQNAELALVLEITHVKQQQELDVRVFASEDGVAWGDHPVAAFLAKQHCGSYKLTVPGGGARYLKALWQVNGRGCNPLFGMCLKVESGSQRTMAAA